MASSLTFTGFWDKEDEQVVRELLQPSFSCFEDLEIECTHSFQGMPYRAWVSCRSRQTTTRAYRLDILISNIENCLPITSTFLELKRSLREQHIEDRSF